MGARGAGTLEPRIAAEMRDPHTTSPEARLEIIRAAVPWVALALRESSGLSFDDDQVCQVTEVAFDKSAGILEAGEDAAIANKRRRIEVSDLPVAYGLLQCTFGSDPLVERLGEIDLEECLCSELPPLEIADQARDLLPRLFAAIVSTIGTLVAMRATSWGAESGACTTPVSDWEVGVAMEIVRLFL